MNLIIKYIKKNCCINKIYRKGRFLIFSQRYGAIQIAQRINLCKETTLSVKSGDEADF